jgi:hypothetical protein
MNAKQEGQEGLAIWHVTRADVLYRRTLLTLLLAWRLP